MLVSPLWRRSRVGWACTHAHHAFGTRRVFPETQGRREDGVRSPIAHILKTVGIYVSEVHPISVSFDGAGRGLSR